MSVSVDWKPGRAVQAKIRDKKKRYTIILIGWNPKRVIYAKVKDHDKVTASVRHNPLGASNYHKTSDSKRPQIKDSEQGQFKVVRENSGYCVQYTFPIYLPFSKNFQRSVEPRYWRVTTQFIKFELVPIYLELSFILFAWFLLFLMAILEAKIFKVQNLFYILWKVRTTNAPSLNSWVVGAYISVRSENGYIPEEKHG